MNDSITKEQVLNAYNSAPDPVRAVFNDEATTQACMGLQTEFQLNAGQASEIGKGVGYLLLGLIEPEQFLQELHAAGVPDQQARQIMGEVNQKIFVPLREQMQRAAPAAPAASISIPPSPPVAARAPAQQPDSYFHLVNKITPPASAATLEDEKLLEDHEEPHIEFRQAAPPPPPVVPPRPAPPRPILPRFVPPEHLPGAMPQPDMPTQAKPPFTPPPSPPPSPSVPPPAPLPPRPVLPPSARPYPVDPYREPVDGEGGT